VSKGKHELVWSYILEYENNQNPFPDRRFSVAEWKEVAGVHVIANEEILGYAEKIQLLGIKVKDSIHIACAVYSGSKYFLTTDRKLLNAKISEIKIRNPIDFLREEEQPCIQKPQ
jgi:predicted nucleic acid-binding protein